MGGSKENNYSVDGIVRALRRHQYCVGGTQESQLVCGRHIGSTSTLWDTKEPLRSTKELFFFFSWALGGGGTITIWYNKKDRKLCRDESWSG